MSSQKRHTFQLARRSKDDPLDKSISIKSQFKHGEDLAKRYGWGEIERIQESGVPAGSLPLDERPEAMRLWNGIESSPTGTIRLVLAYQDRLCRSIPENNSWWWLLKRQAVELWVEGYLLNLDSDREYENWCVQGVSSEVFSSKLSKRQKQSKKDIAASKDEAFRFMGHTLPYGYAAQKPYAKMLQKSGVEKSEANRLATERFPDPQLVYQNEEEAQWLRELYRLHRDKGYGLADLCHWAEENGIRPRTAKKWSTTTMRCALSNTWLYGIRNYNQTSSVKEGSNTRRVHNPPDQWIIMRCEPIFTKAEVEAVTESLRNTRASFYRRSAGKHSWLLKSLLKCGQCGKTYYGHSESARKSDGIRPRFHRCYGRFDLRNGCTNKRISADWAEAHVLTHLLYYLSRPEAVVAAYEAYRQEVQPDVEEANKRLKVARRELRDLESQLNNATEAIVAVRESSDLEPKALYVKYQQLEINHKDKTEEVERFLAESKAVEIPTLAKEPFEESYVRKVKSLIKSKNIDDLREILSQHIIQIRYGIEFEEPRQLAYVSINRIMLEHQYEEMLEEGLLGEGTPEDILDSPFRITWKFPIANVGSVAVANQVPLRLHLSRGSM